MLRENSLLIGEITSGREQEKLGSFLRPLLLSNIEPSKTSIPATETRRRKAETKLKKGEKERKKYSFITYFYIFIIILLFIILSIINYL